MPRHFQAAALVALALAACSVTIEGAPCQGADNCPAGQGCGADARCSSKALTCTPCRPGEQRCSPEGKATCGALEDGVCTAFAAPVAPPPHHVCDDSGGAARFVCAPPPCTAAGTACSSSRTGIVSCAVDADGCLYVGEQRPCSPGLTCAGQGSSVACVCPDAGGVFAADPVNGSAEGSVPAPTGAVEPAQCRFRSLASALGAANQRVQAAGGATATVRAVGWTGGGALTFPEDLPDVRTGVTLTVSDLPQLGAQPPVVPYVIESARAVVVHDGATLSGFELRPGADGLVAIAIACGAGATEPASVQDVLVQGVQGPNHVAVGIQQAAGCPFAVRRSTFEGVAVAVKATAGVVTVDGCRLAGSSGTAQTGKNGVVLDGRDGPVSATIRGTTVTGMSDTALVVNQLGAAASLAVLDSTLTGNCAATSYLVPGGTRRAGGVAFVGELPATELHGNAVYANGYDQVLVANSAGTLRLVGDATAASGSCPAPTQGNQIACLDAGHAGYGVFSGGAAVPATGNFWGNIPPSRSSRDYNDPVDPVGGDGLQACGLAPLGASCPPIVCP